MGYPRADWKDLVGSMKSKGRLQRTEGPLTLKFDRATLAFLKIDMRHGAYRHGVTY